MLLLVIAIAAVQLFAAVLATFDMPATKSDSDLSYGTLQDGTRLVCRGSDTMPAKNIDFLEDKVTSFRLSRETDYHIPLPSGYCAQIRCNDATAILYCNNRRAYGITESPGPVHIDFQRVSGVLRYIVDSCKDPDSGEVSGQLWYNDTFSSVVVTQQTCHGVNEMTYGPRDDDPFSMGNDDPPRPSATTKANGKPAASEAPSTTSTHSTKISKPKSHKTASSEPPTTTHKASETNTNSSTDQDWLLTTCFSESSPERAVFSSHIVQDNIGWIADKVKTVPRNPGEGNCTRLACHRNSAIFFCNDDGDLHSDLENPNQIVDGARKIVSACRLQGKNTLGDSYVDIIAGEIIHKDNWRVVVQSSPCDTQAQGDQVTAQIAPDDNKPKTTPSSKDKHIKSESRSSINKALDFLRPKTRNNDLTIRGAIRAARACKASAPPSKKVVRRDPPPGYVRHSCWGSLKNASFPSPIEAGIYYLNNLDGRPGINAGKCDQVSCSWDTAISWCSTNLERFELDSFKQIAAGAQFILDNCDVPADTCWVGHDISGQVWFKDKWSVVVSGSLQHC